MSRWSSREQALADVARASGGSGVRRLASNVDDTCFVYGGAKPQRRVIHEDDQLELHLGVATCAGGAGDPDLPGISRLLRMTDDYGGAVCERGDSLTSAGVVITKPRSPWPAAARTTHPPPPRIADYEPTKLNPNVKEFIPKGALTDNRSALAAAGLVPDSESSDQTQRERAELFLMLRHRIYDTHDDDDDDDNFRRKKYAAIANLLKAGATAACASPPTPPPLRTPDYFQRSVPPLQEGGGGEASEADVRLSIEKVTDWFAHKPRQRSALPPTPLNVAPHLGPVAYKRKERATPSPSGHVEQKQQRAARGGGGGGAGSYVPSPLAAELSAQWGAREESESADPPLGLWERVERDLRRRDDELRGQPLNK